MKDNVGAGSKFIFISVADKLCKVTGWTFGFALNPHILILTCSQDDGDWIVVEVRDRISRNISCERSAGLSKSRLRNVLACSWICTKVNATIARRRTPVTSE